MDFKDFKGKEQELVGKKVLLTYGYIGGFQRSITVISKVTKTGFRVESHPIELFDLRDGDVKRAYSKTNIGTSIGCKLLDEDEEAKLREKWAIAKRHKHLSIFIKENMKFASIESLENLAKEIQETLNLIKK